MSVRNATKARHAGNNSLEQLIKDLQQISSDFNRLWPDYEAPSTLDGLKHIQHPSLGLLNFEHSTLLVPNNPDVKVMLYAPDSETEAKLE
jgi:hypothetical protein